VRNCLPVLCLVALTAACGGDKNPNTPTPPPAPAAPTRVILLEASLQFGNVDLGASFERTLRIYNTGNAVLTVTGMSVPSGSAFTADWTSGSIQPGTSRVVTIFFRPTEHRSYSGSLTVNSDATAGTNSIPIQAMGIAPIWKVSGAGNTVFTMPSHVSRTRVIGTYGANSSNFIVRLDGFLLVNELMGTFWNMTRYEGIHLTTGGGVVQITNSAGVAWSFEEVR
jgi:hypothetical protein